ncbi:MAG: hypothetical protein XE10_0775 [Methanoculleus marisnigri]|jgi:hypothetical protein|uniref:Lipoprotein n=1 Tax=Methanoculleus marisnigri TaxID=2198 RepID=A0A124G560_9EURY|nr:hypothetical protein [Methanoculleus marisnigri]KUL02206.1 MAG: hypothetical protein XE10_0775 [Methanoculleus marisnigri]
MDPVKVYTGVRGGLSPLLLISLILSCGCMQGSGTGHDDVVWTETLDCRGNESEIELVQIALRDEQVVDAVSNHSFETEIAVSNLNWGEGKPEEVLVVRFWLFNGTYRPNGEYVGIYSVSLNDSKQVVLRSWDYPPRYPPGFPVEMKVNLTDRSICTYHNQEDQSRASR